MVMTSLPFIFMLIIGFIIIMYVVLDGFTLGTGMLLPFLEKEERDLAMSVILPTWDGNQTWLVLGGATLYGSFPLAFSLLLPALYAPLLLMVIALLFRGIVFEFRLKSAHRGWDVTFSAASLMVTLIQGYVLATFVQGFTVGSDTTQVMHTASITLFTVVCSASLAIGYGLLGATRLILKTVGSIQVKMYRAAYVCSLSMAVAMVVVSVLTLFVHPEVKQIWFNHALWPRLWVLPAITAVLFGTLWLTLFKKREISPYWLAVLLFLCPYAGFIISTYPYIVPYSVTWQAAASPDNSLTFLLVGQVIMLPVLLFYTGYSYRIFTGKVKTPLHY